MKGLGNVFVFLVRFGVLANTNVRNIIDIEVNTKEFFGYLGQFLDIKKLLLFIAEFPKHGQHLHAYDLHCKFL